MGGGAGYADGITIPRRTAAGKTKTPAFVAVRLLRPANAAQAGKGAALPLFSGFFGLVEPAAQACFVCAHHAVGVAVAVDPDVRILARGEMLAGAIAVAV